MRFRDQWLHTCQKKRSILCVGIDPAEAGQRAGDSFRDSSKLQWTLERIEEVAPYTSAIKLNRNYFKDLSRHDMQTLNDCIHSHGMLSIDDSKLADIGETNDAGLYHAACEHFDAVTFAPFPGNLRQAAAQAHNRNLGLIPLIIMSNPEFASMKMSILEGQPLFRYLAAEAATADVDAIVIGAPSPSNHISLADVKAVAELLPHALVLVPGLGTQGGDPQPILSVFGLRTIANVGRAIIYDKHPAEAAKRFRDSLLASAPNLFL